MKMNEGLDTGPIARTKQTRVRVGETAGELHDELAQIGAHVMVRALRSLELGTLKLKRQPARGATYANKITKDETRIDWRRPWQQVHDHCRGLSPFPGAWFETPDGTRVKVLRTTKGGGAGAPGALLDDKLTIACGEGAVRLLEVQRAGRQAMQAEEFLRGGTSLKPGVRVS